MQGIGCTLGAVRCGASATWHRRPQQLGSSRSCRRCSAHAAAQLALGAAHVGGPVAHLGVLQAGSAGTGGRRWSAGAEGHKQARGTRGSAARGSVAPDMCLKQCASSARLSSAAQHSNATRHHSRCRRAGRWGRQRTRRRWGRTGSSASSRCKARGVAGGAGERGMGGWRAERCAAQPSRSMPRLGCTSLRPPAQPSTGHRSAQHPSGCPCTHACAPAWAADLATSA